MKRLFTVFPSAANRLFMLVSRLLMTAMIWSFSATDMVDETDTKELDVDLVKLLIGVSSSKRKIKEESYLT